MLVVGSGPAGLAAATGLQARGAAVQVWEPGPRAGGNCQTDVAGGFTVDRGPNGWLDNEPAMDRLLERLGLREQVRVASAEAKRRWIAWNGALYPAPLSPPALVASRLLTVGQKLRILADLVLPRGGGPDETVAAFVRRRLGPGVLEQLVGPMCQGVYGADAEQLALEAVFPKMAALEREHRSLILAALRLGRGGAPPGRLSTLPGGAGALTAAMAARLGEGLHLGRAAVALERRGAGWRVQAEQGAEDVDAVVLACPAAAAAGLLRAHAPEAAAALHAMPYAPIAVAALSMDAAQMRPEQRGFGALLARGEDLGGALGVLLSSCVFPEQAPPGQALLRVMLGGASRPEVLELDDQALLRRAQAAVHTLFGWGGLELRGLYRYPRGIPVYGPGHLGRVQAARQAEALPGLVLCGNHLDGVAIKDCARGAEAAVQRLLGPLSPGGG